MLQLLLRKAQAAQKTRGPLRRPYVGEPISLYIRRMDHAISEVCETPYVKGKDVVDPVGSLEGDEARVVRSLPLDAVGNDNSPPLVVYVWSFVH